MASKEVTKKKQNYEIMMSVMWAKYRRYILQGRKCANSNVKLYYIIYVVFLFIGMDVIRLWEIPSIIRLLPTWSFQWSEGLPVKAEDGRVNTASYIFRTAAHSLSRTTWHSRFLFIRWTILMSLYKVVLFICISHCITPILFRYKVLKRWHFFTF